MADQGERCVAFQRALRRRQAARVVETPVGEALFEDALPLVYDLNLIAVSPGLSASAAELAAEADRVQGSAGLGHRKLAIDEDPLAIAVAPGFRELGWDQQPLVVMPHRGGGREVGTTAVEEVSRAELEPAWAAGIRAGGLKGDVVRQLVEAKSVTERAADVRFFATRAAGEVASYCELYSRDGIAQIEAVMTLPAHRRRGLASAVVVRALEESRAAGNELTFLVAEEADWPKELYRKLGFEIEGRIWAFSRKLPVLGPRSNGG